MFLMSFPLVSSLISVKDLTLQQSFYLILVTLSFFHSNLLSVGLKNQTIKLIRIMSKMKVKKP